MTPLESDPAQDLPESEAEAEEADESPLALSLHYQNISVSGAGQIFSTLALKELTTGAKSAGGTSARGASVYRASPWGLPEIRHPKPTWEHGKGSKTSSMPERKRWQHGGNST